ncbi:MAG: hypothetical protein NDF55_04805 [archaeon GB-1867-005]|nr:hypothetical protein [Candidatus Culexmicrobium cathedralense]
MTSDPIPIITPDNFIPYLSGNWTRMVIYTAISMLVEAALFKIAYRESKCHKAIAFFNLISTPISWIFAVLLALPFTYNIVIGELNPTSLPEWKMVSCIYASVYFMTFILLTSLIEIVLYSALKIKCKKLTSTVLIANFISLLAILFASTTLP